jgi:predicted nuclease of restriction endonuclease-like RecB superfamily
MLTKQQRIYRWIKPGSLISSDRLEAGCLPHLARAIAVYRRMIGHERGRVRNAARAALGLMQPDRVEAIVELLDDAAVYEWPRGSRQGEMRVRVFEAAAREHPVLDPARGAELLDALIARNGEQPRLAVPLLYADYPEFHRLIGFPADYAADALQTDYDLAQAQALLYDAVRVTVDATSGFRHIVQYARLSRLLHRLTRLPDGGYRLMFDGPNSVLRHTHAYGVDFARFLAALVQAQGWRLRAEVALRKGMRPALFTLSDADGLRSRVPAPALFDSQLEERFSRKFGDKRQGWRLTREALILEAGETLLVPDFAFTHEDGTEVALEIVGYWTPEYLAEKFAKLSRVRAPNLIVAVRRDLALRAGTLPAGILSATILPYRSRILLKDVLARLEGLRQSLASGADDRIQTRRRLSRTGLRN